MRRYNSLGIRTILILACVVAAFPVAADNADETLSPYFFVRGGDPSLDNLPLERTAVDVRISGVVAEVTVRQSYANEGSRPIHASYIFPASTRAAVHGMRMVIDDQVITAQIREKQQARAEFDAAKREGKSASLLEQKRPNVFSMQVANLMPGDRIDVELSYTELLMPTDGVYEFVYPTVVGPRYAGGEASAGGSESPGQPYCPEGEPPAYELTLAGSIAAGMPLYDVGSSSHELRVDWASNDSAAFELEASESRGGNRDFVLRYRLAGGEIASGLLLHDGVRENHFMLMVQPPQRVAPAAIPPREYVFILDVSGSMNGFPLKTAKTLMVDLISRLRASDSFNVMLFAGDARVMAPQSLPATAASIDIALGFLEQGRGSGGTELLSAMKRAMNLPHEQGVSRSFVVVTDGYIGAERNVFEYVRRNLGDANMFAFGIGTSVNRFLIEGLARAGMGEPFVVVDPTEAAATAERFREYIESPLLTDIEIQFNGFDAYDLEPAGVPDLLADRPLLIQGKWRGDASGTITVSGVTGDGRFAPIFDVQRFRGTAEQPVLPRLWARTRIARLSEPTVAPSDEEIAEVTALGLSHNLLTRYTSFIAVYELLRNPGEEASDVRQPLPLPAGVGNLAVGDEPALAPLIAAIVLLACAAWFRS